MKNPGTYWHKNRIKELAKLQANASTNSAYAHYTAMLDEEEIAAKAAGLSDYIVQRLKESAEYENPKRGGSTVAKKRRPRRMKVLGIPVVTAAILGGLVWWLATRK